ncbi:alpha/beta fold hydrolase [Rhizobium sp. LEGMi135b]
MNTMEEVSSGLFLKEFYVGQQPEQMYVQRLRARSYSSAKPPIILIHGGNHTGVMWTTTPDGCCGWAIPLAEAGYEVYIVDWPGMGRSGVFPGTRFITPTIVANCIAALASITGPAILIGHSIGGGVCIKVAERFTSAVRAVVALAPSAVEIPNTQLPPPVLQDGWPLTVPQKDFVKSKFATSPLFPIDCFENYFASLQGANPDFRAAAAGRNDELKLDRTKLWIWETLPALHLVAEDDLTVPTSSSAETAKIMGVPLTKLEADWGLKGFGHMFPIERGQERIAARLLLWLDEKLLSR